ncbi:hypothetical protein ACMD2_17077 [Ananas comosus]|uniref:Uncharacterized protein n=1 Tax=Ananas comosus TaxID=4615 RepID=A0A199VUB4_ANACO|nr:hypothetical protein ACMD2_17077 [Ananas comosus]
MGGLGAPCYITSFLTIVILGVGLNAKPDLTLETWAHQKALERLQKQEQIAAPKLSDRPLGSAPLFLRVTVRNMFWGHLFVSFCDDGV